MNDENKISVVINTYNAERDLERVLDAVKDFDEVLICDMESTDKTLDIAKKYGCRIVTFERKTYNIVEPAREFAIHEARFDWVLVVDADEIVTPELKQYLYQRIKENGCPDGLYIPRKNYFMGRFMRCHYPVGLLLFIVRLWLMVAWRKSLLKTRNWLLNILRMTPWKILSIRRINIPGTSWRGNSINTTGRLLSFGNLSFASLRLIS